MTKNEYWKPSISASQDSFLITVTSESDVFLTKERRGEFYKNMGLGCQPYIIAVGNSVKELTKFYVVVEHVLYKFNSFLLALDTCFKIYTVLNLKYAIECESVWIFIEKFFFRICTTKTKISPNIISVISELES